MKFVERLIPVVLCALSHLASAQFIVTPSDADACQCTGSITFQPTGSQSYSYQLFDVSNIPVAASSSLTGPTSLNNLCPSVYHIVVEYANGTIEDHYFNIDAGTNSLGTAYSINMCLEQYPSIANTYDLTPETSSFAPGGIWYAPNGLIIPNASLSSIAVWQQTNPSNPNEVELIFENGWYTYTTSSGGCDVTSGIYIQTNDVGLTTTYVICETYEPFQMVDFMAGSPDTIGQWFDASLNIVPGGIFDPATMDDALFTYVIDNLAGCQPVFRSMFVDEQTQRLAGASASIMVCEGSSPFNLLNQLQGTPDDGGNWTGPSGLITPAGSDVFNPSTLQEGVYTYTISSAQPCIAQISTLTITYTQDNPSGLSADVDLCSTANNLNMLNALDGNPIPGGTWTNQAGEIVDGAFNPGAEPAGNYEYYYPNVGCDPASSTLSISVEAPANAGSNGSTTICQTDAAFNLNSMLSSNATSGGTWSTNGNVVSNIFTPSASGPFNYIYQVNANVCADDQASFSVFVQPAVAEPLSQTIYLCSLGEEVDLADYFSNLSNVYFESATGALVSNLFDPALEASVQLNVINPSGNSCPDQEGQLNIQVLQPLIEDATTPYDVCRSTSLFNLNTALPPAAVGMGTWLNSSNEVISNFVAIDFIGTESYVYEVIQPIDCGGERLQIDLITYTPNDAGDDAEAIFCYTDGPELLSDFLPESQSGAGAWYFNNSPFNSSTFDPGQDASGTYVYRIQANGPCPADEALVDLNVQLGINYSAGQDIHVCAGASNQLLGGTPAPGATYSWTPTSGIDNATDPSPSVNIPAAVNQQTTTVYTVLADDGVCTFTDNVSVIVEPNPLINLNSAYDLCFGETLSLANVVNTTCIWTPSNLFEDPTSLSPLLQPASSVYIGVQATSDFGCVSNAFSQINVNPLPVLIVQSDPVRGCKPIALEIIPSVESQNIDQIVWNVAGIGTFIADTLELDLVVPGVYDIEATAISENNCVSTLFLEEIAEVYPSPVAHFTISPFELTTLEPEADFTNHSVGASYYHWWFNGLDESMEENPSFTFPNERSDNFYVCLDVTNQYGCSDTTCRYVYMDAEYIVFAPNAFTPDGDGDNDLWKPIIRGFDTAGYELRIFNRWGDSVFYSNNPDEPWTGDIENGLFFGQNEVYNWIIKLRIDNSAEEISFNGSVLMIR